MNQLEYRLWKAPSNGLPEFSGHSVTIIPGFGSWILLHPSNQPWPKGSIPVNDLLEFLERK